MADRSRSRGAGRVRPPARARSTATFGRRLHPVFFVVLVAALLAGGCRTEGEGPVQEVRVPRGASFSAVADSLDAHDIVRAPKLFRLYARITGADSRVQAGTYGFRRGTGWARVLDDLRNGRVLTRRIVVPEGWNLRGIAQAFAEHTGEPADALIEMLTDSAIARQFGVPGPTLEGYLYPASYDVPVDAPVERVIGRMVRRYQSVWTPLRRARADSLEMSEREVVTLASIIEAEAKVQEEMPTIGGVFHNRLRIGIPLQADPTVQYARGRHESRLLYPHIESVADHPYNTYTRRGLPPGPIASPSVQAIDAALWPADVDYLYFVARPDGSHIFTRSLAEHNRARAQVRAERQSSQGDALP